MIRRAGRLLGRVAATAGLATAAAGALWPVSWALDRIVVAYADTAAPRLWQHWAEAVATATAEELTIGTVNALAAAALFGAGWALADRLGLRLARDTGEDPAPVDLPPVPRRHHEVVI